MKLSADDIRLIEIAARRRGDHSTAELCDHALGDGEVMPDGRARLLLERDVEQGKLKVPRLVEGP